MSPFSARTVLENLPSWIGKKIFLTSNNWNYNFEIFKFIFCWFILNKVRLLTNRYIGEYDPNFNGVFSKNIKLNEEDIVINYADCSFIRPDGDLRGLGTSEFLRINLKIFRTLRLVRYYYFHFRYHWSIFANDCRTAADTRKF